MIWTFLIVCIGLVSAETVHPERLSELRAAGKHEEFAKLLGIDDVELISPSNEQRSEFPEFDSLSSKHDSPFGDIMLTKEQREQGEEARHHIDFRKRDYTRYMWPRGKVYYYIYEPDFNWFQIAVIEKAFGELNKLLSTVAFVEYSNVCKPEDYLFIFNSTGFWTLLGRRGGPQPFVLQNNRWFFSDTPMRLAMFALGFYLEQCRCDRDNHIEVNENITEAYRHRFQKVSCDVFRAPDPYDFDSMLHSPVIIPETGERAFTVKDDDVDENKIGYKTTLSPDDVRKANSAYRWVDRQTG